MIRIAGHLHDTGEIGVHGEALCKFSPLTDVEWDVQYTRELKVGGRRLSFVFIIAIRFTFYTDP
jgi:response regulator RpfG family c-di-GMP phosphodiesterase